MSNMKYGYYDEINQTNVYLQAKVAQQESKTTLSDIVCNLALW